MIWHTPRSAAGRATICWRLELTIRDWTHDLISGKETVEGVAQVFSMLIRALPEKNKDLVLHELRTAAESGDKGTRTIASAILPVV